MGKKTPQDRKREKAKRRAARQEKKKGGAAKPLFSTNPRPHPPSIVPAPRRRVDYDAFAAWLAGPAKKAATFDELAAGAQKLLRAGDDYFPDVSRSVDGSAAKLWAEEMPKWGPAPTAERDVVSWNEDEVLTADGWRVPRGLDEKSDWTNTVDHGARLDLVHGYSSSGSLVCVVATGFDRRELSIERSSATDRYSDFDFMLWTRDGAWRGPFEKRSEALAFGIEELSVSRWRRFVDGVETSTPLRDDDDDDDDDGDDDDDDRLT